MNFGYLGGAVLMAGLCLAPAATATESNLHQASFDTREISAQKVSLETNEEYRSLVGMPVIGQRTVKIGHVVAVPAGKDGGIDYVLVDTSSSGRQGLEKILVIGSDLIDVTPYHIRVAMP